MSFKHCLATVPTQQPEARQRCQDAYTTALITQYHCVPAFLLIKHAVNLRHLLETQTQQPADPQPTIAERAAQHALAAKIIEWQAYDKANSWW
ncbi:MAG TPA: hypothetical protein VJJ83_04570 [Candidatus Babeliales bacterium]|nr:hypothetical protein [Candidatus Babeliales bacterium]